VMPRPTDYASWMCVVPGTQWPLHMCEAAKELGVKASSSGRHAVSQPPIPHVGALRKRAQPSISQACTHCDLMLELAALALTSSCCMAECCAFPTNHEKIERWHYEKQLWEGQNNRS
jgi:hypothetical protein